MNENPLHQLMNPRSIAIVGAGNNPMKMGTIQALSIIKDGFPGKIFPLHPREKEVLGLKSYPTASDLPETPDLVMFILPAPLVVDLIDDFGKIGTKRAIIISAGFRETGAAGLQLEEQLKAKSRSYGIRFLGPNCMGIVNSVLPLNVTVAPLVGPPGLLGMASQSGTYITQTLPYLQQRGIRFSRAVSVGNEGDIDLVDALDYLGSDEQTKAIALYIEGLKDGQHFLETARRITPHKPVIAQYVGGSAAGARAGSSHTGALAGPDYLYDGLFRQAGVIRAYSIEELYYHGWALASQPALRGKRIAVLTNSGGPGTAMAHICNEGGLEVPAFSKGLREKIEKYLPPHGSSGNPVDLTFHLDTEAISLKIPELILGSGEVDGMVVHGLMGSGFLKAIYPHFTDIFKGMSAEEFAGQVSRDLSEPLAVPQRYGLPIVLSSFFGRNDNYTQAYQDIDVPVYDGPEKAAAAMVAIHHYNLVRQRPKANSVAQPPLPAPEAVEMLGAALERKSKALDEYSSKKMLAAYGANTSEEGLAHSRDEAAALAAAIGYPVALKACAEQYTHKTGRGLVALDLKDENELLKEYDQIEKAAGKETAMLVAKMIKGERELMAGMIRHPGFGPCIMFGLGGIFAETLQDRVFRLAPLVERDLAEMFDEIRSSDLLSSYRGLDAVDKNGLAGILMALSNLALLHPEIAEIDLNPIIVDGSIPVIADALVVIDHNQASS